MAEGWARALKNDVIESYSAGIETHGLNPRAVKVMAEVGVDIAGHRSKNVGELEDIEFDYVVTVCGHANENCPHFPGKVKIVHVGFDDPPQLAQSATSEEEALGHYRRVRDEIRDFVESLPASLLKEASMSSNADEAVKMLCEGFNCAQAILTCCGKGLPIDRDTALAVAGPFGAGMGKTGKTCGAVTGALMVIGLKHPRLDPKDDESKQVTIRLTRELMARFEARNGSIVCKDLLGCDLSTPEGVEKFKALDLIHRVCHKAVRDAAEILNEIL